MRKKILILAIAISFTVLGCKNERVVRIDNFEGAISTNGEIKLNIEGFRLPEGLFCEFNWEFEKEDAFEFRIGDNPKDRYYYTPIPEMFLNFNEKDKREDWDYEKKELAHDLIEYDVRHREKDISFKLKLPFENGKFYSFGILENDNDEYFVLFGTLTNYIKHENDRGIFGYFILRPKPLTDNVKNERSQVAGVGSAGADFEDGQEIEIMKYFGKDIDDSNPNFDAIWTSNVNKYWSYLKSISRLLPKEFASLFCDTSFHDSSVSIEIGDSYIDYRPFGRVEIKIQHAETGAKYKLKYKTIRKLSYAFPTDKPLDDFDGDFYFGDWLYDEIELLDDNWVKQEIIFSSGAELIIEFKDFTYSQKEPHNN